MIKRVAILIFLVTAASIVVGAEVTYDAVVVRSDLPYDWTVAQAFAQRAKIPIITTSPDSLDENARNQLIGFRESGHNNILVFGGEAAISPEVEAEMVDIGFITHRIREVDRYGTSARVALELYGQSESAVIVSGENFEGLLIAQMTAFQTGAPILFVKDDLVPESVKEALTVLGVREIILVQTVVEGSLEEGLLRDYKIRDLGEGFRPPSGRELRVLDIAIGLALGAFLAWVLRYRAKGKVPYNVLTEDEERIIRAVEDYGGEIGQDVLYERTGFSRPKISRLVSELVERDIIEKTQFKRTFKLKMKKELVKD